MVYSSDENVPAEPEAEEDFLVGAPVESVNPLGHEVTLFAAVMLNLGQILGSGIFSIPGVVLGSVGSVGLFFIAWILAPVFAFSGVAVWTELSAMFPNRSGALVVFLEQAYPRPKFMVPISLAVCSVLLSYSATNAIVFAQYVLTAINAPITPSNQTAVAIAASSVATAIACLSTKWSLRVVNALSLFKVLSLIFVVVVGALVLAGATRVEDPWAHFRQPFKGSIVGLNSLATTLIKTYAAFDGWHNAFNLLAEVRSDDAPGTVGRAGYLSLSLVSLLYLFTNVAYIAAIPPAELAQSGQLAGALFFTHVFGQSWTARLLPIMVAASCLGNLIAVIIGSARVLREIARQGLIPYPALFSSSRPFGTPLFPILLKYGMSVLAILLLPAKDAFNFLLDLAVYPFLVFRAAAVVGIWILRTRREKDGLPPASHRALDGVILLSIIWHAFLIFIPWVPPKPGQGDVSFWYATYCVVGMGVIVLSLVYYYMWIVFLPKRGGYEIEEEVEELPDGARHARLVHRYKEGRSVEQQPLLAAPQ